MTPHASMNSFKVGYRNWILWLIIIVDLMAIVLFFAGSLYPLSEEGQSNPNINTAGLIALFLGLFGAGLFMICHLYVIWAELRRTGYAIKIDRTGIHLWRATMAPIPWTEIDAVEIHGITDESRNITILLKSKVRDYPSPYWPISILRFLSFRRFGRELKMYLEGIACNNKTLRAQISSYSDKLER